MASPFTLSVPGGNPDVRAGPGRRPNGRHCRAIGMDLTKPARSIDTIEREQFPGHKPLSCFGAHWISDGWSARKQGRNENRHPHNHLDTPRAAFRPQPKGWSHPPQPRRAIPLTYITKVSDFEITIGKYVPFAPTENYRHDD